MMMGYWLDAVMLGCTFGRDTKAAELLLLPKAERDSVWQHGYRIGCYIRDAYLRLA